jgi:hypothetical protein
MELPPIDRSTSLVRREMTHLAVDRASALAPARPEVTPITTTAHSPGVIDSVNRGDQAGSQTWVYGNPTGLSVHILDASIAQSDGTLKRPVHEKVDDPPPIRLSKMLIDHIKALWHASASAVQVAQPAKDPLASEQTHQNRLPLIGITEPTSHSANDSKLDVE